MFPCSQPVCAMSLYQSLYGNYFVGTATTEFGAGKYAWAGLFNPKNSGVLLFVNVYTVTNATETPFSFQLWLNAVPTGKRKTSDTFSPTNLLECPPSQPKTHIVYAENTDSEPIDGSFIFGRRCPAESTVVAEEDGKFIIPPGGNFLVHLLPPETSAEKISVPVAFGWWEEKCS